MYGNLNSMDTLQTSASPAQVNFLEPEKIVRNFGLEKGDHVADFGAGHGYWTIPMAKIVGGDGRVYALDIQKPVLEIIKTRAKLEHLLNIEYVWTDLDAPKGSRIKDKFCDFAVIANILFQAEQKAGLFQEAWRVLREGGRLAVMEWDQSPAPLGPPLNARVKKEEVRRWAGEAGFSEAGEFEAGSHHYGLMFQKP